MFPKVLTANCNTPSSTFVLYYEYLSRVTVDERSRHDYNVFHPPAGAVRPGQSHRSFWQEAFFYG